MFGFTRNQLVAAYVIIAFGLLGTGFLMGRSGVFSGSVGEVRLIQPSTDLDLKPIDDVATDAVATTLKVHVAGRVKRPGVYSLEPGSRVIDAIKAAGGETSDADLESINLADRLEDGQQIYIAARGEVPHPKTSVVLGGKKTSTEMAIAPTNGEQAAPQKLKTPGEGKVNINTAGLEELQRLPGIGPALAERILEYRQEHGRFGSVEELEEVKGIGPKKLEKMRPFVSL